MTHAQAKNRHAALAEEIRRHDHAYYAEAKPTISDQAYDRLYHELLDLEKEFSDLITPDSPSQRVSGEPLTEFKPVPHLSPMLSLDNTYSQEEVRNFVARVQKLLPGETLEWMLEPKVDGVAINLRYENGRFTVGSTRGDGTTGDDVTANLKTIRSIPTQLRPSAHHAPKVMEVRGEVYLTKTGFARLNAERAAAGDETFANPRNAAAGSLKQLDPKIVAKRPLDIVTYGLGEFSGGKKIMEHEAMLAWLKSAGFKTPEKVWKCHSAEELISALDELDKRRDKFAYETDGAVIKLNSYASREKVGYTSKAPRWAIAYKYAAEQAETKLKAITIQVGRTGALTPVAELEPVFLAGSTISRATLHNEDYIHDKDIRIGDTVTIEKAGEVIPAVVNVVLKKRPHPEPAQFNFSKHIEGKCPACGGQIARDPEFAVWRCQNVAGCPAQSVRRIEFMSQRRALDIEGLGEVVAEKLVERSLVREPLDLFELTVDQLAKLNLGTTDEPRIFGEKNATRVREALERAKTFPLARWLFALGIQEVGETTAYEIAKFHKNLEQVANSLLLKGIAKLGNLYDEKAVVSPFARKNRPKNPEERDRRKQQFEKLKKDILDLGEELQKEGVADRNKNWLTLSEEKRESSKAASEFTTIVGTKVATNIVVFFESNTGKKVLSRLQKLGVNPKGSSKAVKAQPDSTKLPFSGKIFVLTGTLNNMTRDKATDEIRVRGGSVAGSVSKNTDFLVAGDEAGSKLRIAAELGVKTLTENEFLNMLNLKPSSPKLEEKEQKDLL